MRVESVPLGTPHDSAEDSSGSVDPLGTVTGAEQLADVLFAGMTAPMWRTRHLTFAALAAWVAQQAANRSGGQSRQNCRRQNKNAATQSATSSNARDASPTQAADGPRSRRPGRPACPAHPSFAGCQSSGLDPPAVQSIHALREQSCPSRFASLGAWRCARRLLS